MYWPTLFSEYGWTSGIEVKLRHGGQVWYSPDMINVQHFILLDFSGNPKRNCFCKELCVVKFGQDIILLNVGLLRKLMSVTNGYSPRNRLPIYNCIGGDLSLRQTLYAKKYVIQQEEPILIDSAAQLCRPSVKPFYYNKASGHTSF